MKRVLTFVSLAVAFTVGVGLGCGGDTTTTTNPDLAGDLSSAHDQAHAACQYPNTTGGDLGNDPRCPAAYGGPTGTLCVGSANACPQAGIVCTYTNPAPVAGCSGAATMACSPPPNGTTGAQVVWHCSSTN